MADLNSIQNNLSLGEINVNQGGPAGSGTFGNGFRSNADVAGSIRKFRGSTADGALVFPSDRPKYYMILEIAKYSRDSVMSVNFEPKLSSESRIVLPLPPQLIDMQEVAYDEENLGMGLGLAANEAASAINQNQGSMSLLDGAAAAGKSLLSGVAGSTASAALGTTVAQGAAAIIGFSPNQFLTVLLKGPRYKRYEFTWKLVPKNQAESNTIKQICKLLNNSMAPGLAAGGLVFTFPKIFRLAFMPNFQYLYRFKPSVIENLTINYNPGGTPSFYAGDFNAPESVEIKARFLELEYWLEGDWDNDEANAGGASVKRSIFTVGQANQAVTNLLNSSNTSPSTPPNPIQNPAQPNFRPRGR